MKIRGQQVHSPQERILRLSMPEPNSGCWIWLGSVRPGASGIEYGRMIGGSRSAGTRKSYAAHRYSYEAFLGPVPGGLHVCHRCDTGLCVNPDHLFVGTHQDNIDDRERKGRNKLPPVQRGESAHFIKLTDRQILEIRSSALSSRKLAMQIGVGDSYIRQIRRGLYRRPEPPVS